MSVTPGHDNVSTEISVYDTVYSVTPGHDTVSTVIPGHHTHPALE